MIIHKVIDGVSDWIKHSRKNPEGAIECLELIRNKTGLNITNYDIETSEYKPKPLPSDGDKDYTRVRKNLRIK